MVTHFCWSSNLCNFNDVVCRDEQLDLSSDDSFIRRNLVTRFMGHDLCVLLADIRQRGGAAELLVSAERKLRQSESGWLDYPCAYWKTAP